LLLMKAWRTCGNIVNPVRVEPQPLGERRDDLRLGELVRTSHPDLPVREEGALITSTVGPFKGKSPRVPGAALTGAALAGAGGGGRRESRAGRPRGGGAGQPGGRARRQPGSCRGREL